MLKGKNTLTAGLFIGMITVVPVKAFAVEDSTLAVDNKSIFEQERPEYEAGGIHVRAFTIKPKIAVEENYDDNVFYTAQNEKEDMITMVKPAVTVESGWSRHSLNLHASNTSAYFSDNSDENYDDSNIGFDGRLDVLRETFITGGFDYTTTHEERASPDSISSSVEPPQYDEALTRLGFYRGLSRISLLVDNEFRQIDFDDGSTASGATIDNDVRDRDRYDGTVRVGYEFIPNYEAFVRGGYNTRSYDHNAPTLNRDSDGYTVTAGTAVNITGKTRGEVFAGYMEQDYEAVTLPDIDGVNYGASLLWNATPITSVKAGIERSIEETTRTNAAGYIATAYSSSIEHELRRNVLLGAKVAYITNDYEQTAGSFTREDTLAVAGLNAKYLLNRHASIRSDYTYSDRDSNIVNQDFSKNRVMVGVNVAF